VTLEPEEEEEEPEPELELDGAVLAESPDVDVEPFDPGFPELSFSAFLAFLYESER
jgi:hypothetical protein